MSLLNKISIGVFTLIVVGFFVNLMANKFNFDAIWNIGWLVLFLLSFLFNIYFSLHLFFIYKKVPEGDILTFQRIMSQLNIEHTERVLHVYSSNIGFNDSFSIMAETFFNTHQQVRNRLGNRRLRYLMNEFVVAFRNYYNLYSNNAMSAGGVVRLYPEMKTKNPERYYNLIKELDNIGNVAYAKLTKVLEFANKNNINLS